MGEPLKGKTTMYSKASRVYKQFRLQQGISLPKPFISVLDFLEMEGGGEYDLAQICIAVELHTGWKLSSYNRRSEIKSLLEKYNLIALTPSGKVHINPLVAHAGTDSKFGKAIKDYYKVVRPSWGSKIDEIVTKQAIEWGLQAESVEPRHTKDTYWCETQVRHTTLYAVR